MRKIVRRSRTVNASAGNGAAKRKAALWIGAALLGSYQGAAHAQELSTQAEPAKPVSREEPLDKTDIIVTATRRSELLSRVPVSVSAFSQQALDQRGIREFRDIAKVSPGVNFESSVFGKPGLDLSIRGIESRAGTSTTGVYIDDTPIQVRYIGEFAYNVYPRIFDLDRVEILRGPQGTLFGAGSEGGTVRFITPQPSLDKTSIYARSELSFVDGGGPSYEGGIALGAPIVQDKIGLRVSAWYRRDGGWIDRVDQANVPAAFGPTAIPAAGIAAAPTSPLGNASPGNVIQKDFNYKRTYALRGALAFALSDTFSLTPSVHYQHMYSNGPDQFFSYLSNQSSGDFNSGFVGDKPGSGVEKFVLAGLKADYKGEVFNVTANASYFRAKSNYTYDVSSAVATNFGYAIGLPRLYLRGFEAPAPQHDYQRNWTGEIRLQPSEKIGRFNFVIGAFYSHARQESLFSIDGSDLNDLIGVPRGVPVFPLVEPGNLGLFNLSHSLDEQYAGFGEIDYDVTDTITATAGARISHNKVDFDNSNGGLLSGQPTQATVSTSSSPVTPKFTLSYKPNAENLFYATAAKGYRVGGGNEQLPDTLCGPTLAAIGLTAAPKSFASDSLWSYEVGSKNKLFGNLLQLDASAYYIKWKNIQTSTLLACQYSYITNSGDATSKGFEFQATVRPSRGVTLQALVGYVHLRYDDTVYPGSAATTAAPFRIISAGDTIPNQHPLSVTLTGRYDHEIGSEMNGYVNADYTYRSRAKANSYFQDRLSIGYDPGVPQFPAIHLINLRAGATRGPLDFSVFANNLLNRHTTTYYRHEAPNDPTFKNIALEPRVLGVTLTFRQ